MSVDPKNIKNISKKTGQNPQSDFSSMKNSAENTSENIKEAVKKELIRKISEKAEEKVKDLKIPETIEKYQNLNMPETGRTGNPQLVSSSKSNSLTGGQGRMSKINKPLNKEEQISTLRREAQEKSARVTEREIQKVENKKAKILMKLAGKNTERVVYIIASRMAVEANKGGIMEFIVMTISLMAAILKDIIDIAEIELLIFLATLVGIPIVIAIESWLWLFNLFLIMLNLYFWTILLGGGHKKWFWIKLWKMLIFIGLDFLPGIDVMPFATIMVLWNIHDFHKQQKKAKNDLKKFVNGYKSTGKINKKYIKDYV